MPLMAATTPTDPAVQELKAMVAALTVKVGALQQAVDALPAAIASRTVDEMQARLVE